MVKRKCQYVHTYIVPENGPIGIQTYGSRGLLFIFSGVLSYQRNFENSRIVHPMSKEHKCSMSILIFVSQPLKKQLLESVWILLGIYHHSILYCYCCACSMSKIISQKQSQYQRAICLLMYSYSTLYFYNHIYYLHKQVPTSLGKYIVCTTTSNIYSHSKIRFTQMILQYIVVCKYTQ